MDGETQQGGVGPCCFASSAVERGSGRCGVGSVQSLRQRWSNDEMRATDERKRGREKERVRQ